MTIDLKRFAVVPVLFKDTTTGRMLRMLAERTTAHPLPLRAFMAEYHVRCERKRPSRSMFQNNFGRFIARDERGDRTMFAQCTMPCIERSRPVGIDATGTHHVGRIHVAWCGPSVPQILGAMDQQVLLAAIKSMRDQLAAPRATDSVAEISAWLWRLCNEVGANERLRRVDDTALQTTYERMESTIEHSADAVIVQRVRDEISRRTHGVSCGR